MVVFQRPVKHLLLQELERRTGQESLIESSFRYDSLQHHGSGVHCQIAVQYVRWSFCHGQVEPWSKLFQNLRSTRETELVEDFPAHVACRWIGNSQPIAAKHYLQLTDEHFAKAIAGEPKKVAHNAAQKAHATARKERSERKPDDAKTPTKVGICEGLHGDSHTCINLNAPRAGLEPATCGLEDRPSTLITLWNQGFFVLQ